MVLPKAGDECFKRKKKYSSDINMVTELFNSTVDL